jgi:hypothetical protein
VELERPPSNGLNQVTVAVETLDPEIGTDLGWKPVAGAKVTPDNGKVSIKATRAKHTVSRLALARDPKLSAVQLLDPRIRIIPQLIWSGKVTLPEPFNAQKYRLVIQEFESFFADAKQTPNTTHLPTAQVDQRLVYADVVEL